MLALEMGGLAQIWRSYAEDTLQRMEPQFEAPLSTLFQGAGDVVGGLALARANEARVAY